jgi:hypothetical protein
MKKRDFTLADFFAQYGDIISQTGLAERCGFNRSLLVHYLKSFKRPSDERLAHIQEKIRKLGSDLLSVILLQDDRILADRAEIYYQNRILDFALSKFESLEAFSAFFKNEETCAAFLEKARWGYKPICPVCNTIGAWSLKEGYKCRKNTCSKTFTLKSGSALHQTRIPLQIIFAAFYLQNNHDRLSSHRLGKILNISQSGAYHLIKTIIRMKADPHDVFLGSPNFVSAIRTFSVNK